MGRKKHAEHVNLERWLVSYADFITLLFAFFVVMYAISQQDVAKLKAASKSIQEAFGGDAGYAGLLNSGGGQSLNQFDVVAPDRGRAIHLPAGKTHTAADPDGELESLKELLEETVSLEMGTTHAQQVKLVYERRGLVVRLALSDLFEPGRVEPIVDMRPLLDKIGRVLETTSKLIRIEGHADPREIGTPGFEDAWELSTARASWVVRYFLERFHFDPKRVGAAGFSFF